MWLWRAWAAIPPSPTAALTALANWEWSLFWALACSTPGTLFLGLVRSFHGDGPVVTVLGLALFISFIALYSLMLREVEGQ